MYNRCKFYKSQIEKSNKISNIFTVITVILFTLIIGWAGGFECNLLTWKEFFVRAIPTVIVTVINSAFVIEYERRVIYYKQKLKKLRQDPILKL